MTDAIALTIHARDGAARLGTLATPRGDIRTPAFMPVGTAATVKAMRPEDVRATGADIVLSNTYHLMLAPGAERIAALGFKVTPSVGNFILIHFPREPGRSAVDADRFLSERGLVVRNVGAYGLPDALRMTIGTEEANRLVVEALADFAKSTAGK